MSAASESPLGRDEFVELLRAEGAARYHDHHPFHLAMHAGTLSQEQLQAWVRNRYYYQTRIPIKDALILAKSEDPAFRRRWMRRIQDHDGELREHNGEHNGEHDGEGGLALWLRLAAGVGLDPAEVATLSAVLPGVRFACDGYVQLVRERSLLEAVASSLTEFFAPDLMSRRIAAWEQHYPWVRPDVLAYFRARVTRARTDSAEAIEYVLEHARTRADQELCVAALIRKTEILWHLLDCVSMAHGPALPPRPTSGTAAAAGRA
jgi:pyrroloquinoline-quinone synthase